MSERLLPWLFLLVTACGPRQVEITFHTPQACTAPGTADAGMPRECPLRSVRSIATQLVRADGQAEQPDCQPAENLCTFEDLEGFRFLTRGTPSDGVEILIRGYSEPDCGEGDGWLSLSCETFGDSVIELPEVDEVAIWCDCPRTE